MPVLACAWLALAGTVSHAQSPVVLDDRKPVIDLQEAGSAWIDPSAQATIEQVAAGDKRKLMTPVRRNTIYTLGEGAALWQHYRFEPSDSRLKWVLEYPLPLLDKVTVFQKNQAGQWTGETEGDTVPLSSWPEPGRYAQFNLALPEGRVHDVYVRIQHVTQVNIPVNLVSAPMRTHRLQIDYLVIGVVMGALVLLIVAGGVQGWVYRDAAYVWYAVYAGIMTMVVASISGIAGHFLWGDFPVWNNLAQGVLGFLGGSSALLLIRNLCGMVGRQRWFDKLVYGTGLVGPALALAYIGLDRQWGVRLVGAYLLAVIVLGVATAVVAWRRKDMVGVWVLGGFMPLALATLLVVARIFGWVPTTWLSQYAFMLSLAFEVPLLLVALNVRSRERHGVESREQAMASHDALTGLLAAHLFDDRLKQVVSRATRYKESAAVVYVELVNYGYVKRTHGIAVAEQSLLRSVIKLRRILRDVDTVGRVDEACFGLIMEDVSTREPVNELAARLIAGGLMPLKGLKPEVLLQFHVAGALLNERLMEGPALSQSLFDLLASMGERTRRPIRFLGPELTHPAPLAPGSLRDDSDTQSLSSSG